MKKEVFNVILSSKAYRLIGIVSIIFLLSSCDLLSSQNKYLFAKTDSEILFYNKNNKSLSSSEQKAYNTYVKLSWGLLPFDTQTFTYKFDDEGKEAEDSELHIVLEEDSCVEIVPQAGKSVTSVQLKAVEIGKCAVTVSHDKYGSSTVHLESIEIK